MKCSKCGAILADDVLFCRECGAKIEKKNGKIKIDTSKIKKFEISVDIFGLI